MKNTKNETLYKKMATISKSRYLYTYKGLLNEIEKWIIDPFGPKGGYLRCKTVDDKKLKMVSVLH
jgi:hypothetical protein